MRKYAPNLTDDNILWTYMSTPLDISNKYANMVQGSIKQGAYHPLQMGFNRPNHMCSHYKTPIEGLYVCGASSQSGGFITFGPGYNAVNAIADNLGIEKWWSEPELITAYREKGYA